MNLNKWGLCLLVGFSILVNAQSVRRIDLNEAIQLGLDNSKMLQLDKAKIMEAEAGLAEARNRSRPDLKLSASALALSSPTIEMKLPNMHGRAVNPNSALFANLSFSWPLFTGGKIKYGIQSAEYLLEAKRLATQGNQIALAYTISQAYTNLYKAGQAIKILEENLKTSQARDEQLLKLEQNGLLPRNERLKANLQTNHLELQLLEAKSNYKVANLNMNILLAIDEDTLLETDPEFTEETEIGLIEFYKNEALKNRKDLQVIDYQTKITNLAIKIAEADRYPNIALTGGYVAAHIPNLLTITNAVNIGIGIQYDVAQWWKKDSHLLTAQAQQAQLTASQGMLIDQIRTEVIQAYEAAYLSKEKINLLQKAENQAIENYNVVKRKYDNGLATTTELLDADMARILAKINLESGRADTALAMKKLEQTAGIFPALNTTK